MNIKPKLSVAFMTYNHDKYVRQALKSIMDQKTDFDIEIVVGEDCSTDHTRDIIREFDEQYPGKFRLLFREKNLGRATLNTYQTSMECRGQYIAYLQGDDYWTDDHKLQKQVNFLDDHPEYEACTHTNIIVDENGRDITSEIPIHLYEWHGEYSFENYKNETHWPGHTASVVTRNFWHDDKLDYTILYRAHDYIDDCIILLFILLHGNIMRLDDTMSAWRYVKNKDGENWNSIMLKRNPMIEECNLKCTMLQWCEENIGLTAFGRMRAKSEFKTALSVFLKHPSRESFCLARRVFRYNILHVTLGWKIK